LVSGVNTIVGGDDDGNVIRLDATGVYDDYPSNTLIHCVVETATSTFGTNRKKQVLDQMYVRTLNAPDLKTVLIADGQTIPFTGIAKKTGLVASLVKFILGKKIEGTELAARVEWDAKGARSTLREIEIPKVMYTDTYD